MTRNKPAPYPDNTWLLLMVANFLLLALFLALFIGAAWLTVNTCPGAPGRPADRLAPAANSVDSAISIA